MPRILQDVRFGLRILSASPATAAVAILTLGLGIACTTTVFSWIDTIILHQYPGATQSNELAILEMVTATAPNGGTSISWPDYRDYRDNLKGVSGVAVFRQCAFSLGDGQPAKMSWGELVSGNYFDVMGVKPLLGRVFTQEENDDKLGAHPVTVISARLWRSYFHSDPAIVGKRVRVNRHLLTIAGVIPAEYRGTSPVLQYDLWVPVTMGVTLGLLPDTAFPERGDRGRFAAICRRRPEVSLEQLRSEVQALAATLATAYPRSNRGVQANVLLPSEAHNSVNEYLRAPLAILLAVSCLVLLIVCANVANLLLARSVGRQREFGIRVALGASRPRVAAQVMTETMLLAFAGAVLGMLLLMWMQGWLVEMVPSIGIPINMSVVINVRILGFTALACLAAALISGTSPALFVFHANLNEVLKESSRSDTAGVASHRTRNILVIGEVALATVALIGAGLFIRSFHNLRNVNPGFDASGVLLGRFFIETSGQTGEQIRQFASRLKQQLTSAPGVESVTYSDFVPLSSTAGPYNNIQAEGYTPAEGEATSVNRALVSPGYFATMRIPLVEGRDFTTRDDRAAEPVIIIDQAFANRFFAGHTPVGRKVRAAGKWRTVVAVARDSKFFSPAEAISPHFYLPFDQVYNATPELYFLVRTEGSPEQAIPLFRRFVAQSETNSAAFHAVPLSEYTQLATFGQKVAANLIGALGLMCLLLAGSGLYSVMSYTVSQRIPEIGIRMTMGASPLDVITMVVGQGMTLALTGMAVGGVLAFAAARLVASMLFQVDLADPTTAVLAVLFLLAVALFATWLPAYRATRIDPMSALRR